MPFDCHLSTDMTLGHSENMGRQELHILGHDVVDEPVTEIGLLQTNSRVTSPDCVNDVIFFSAHTTWDDATAYALGGLPPSRKVPKTEAIQPHSLWGHHKLV